jgi:hypothetical protein
MMTWLHIPAASSDGCSAASYSAELLFVLLDLPCLLITKGCKATMSVAVRLACRDDGLLLIPPQEGISST